MACILQGTTLQGEPKLVQMSGPHWQGHPTHGNAGSPHCQGNRTAISWKGTKEQKTRIRKKRQESGGGQSTSIRCRAHMHGQSNLYSECGHHTAGQSNLVRSGHHLQGQSNIMSDQAPVSGQSNLDQMQAPHLQGPVQLMHIQGTTSRAHSNLDQMQANTAGQSTSCISRHHPAGQSTSIRCRAPRCRPIKPDQMLTPLQGRQHHGYAWHHAAGGRTHTQAGDATAGRVAPRRCRAPHCMSFELQCSSGHPRAGQSNFRQQRAPRSQGGRSTCQNQGTLLRRFDQRAASPRLAARAPGRRRARHATCKPRRSIGVSRPRLLKVST